MPVECEQTLPSSAGPEESRRILKTFADRGGNYFDTANEVYSAGLSERILGEFVGSDRHRYVVRLGTSSAAVALAWVRDRGVIPMIGARKVSQVEDSLQYLSLKLPADEM